MRSFFFDSLRGSILRFCLCYTRDRYIFVAQIEAHIFTIGERYAISVYSIKRPEKDSSDGKVANNMEDRMCVSLSLSPHRSQLSALHRRMKVGGGHESVAAAWMRALLDAGATPTGPDEWNAIAIEALVVALYFSLPSFSRRASLSPCLNIRVSLSDPLVLLCLNSRHPGNASAVEKESQK